MVTISEFDNYINNFDDDTVRVALKGVYIDAATNIIIDYLGYDPDKQTYTEVLVGNGDRYLQLNAKPVDSVVALSIDGVALNTADTFSKSKNSEWLVASGFTFPKDSEIDITYVAGYTEIPGAIKLTVLRIAALLHTEAGGNIGITSKSFDNSNRTFYQFTNFQKYLNSIDSYRIVRL